ncbi:NAD(P)H-binding protein [Kribbella sp. NPDC048915]|uniref:SDR family oxidoreductase n=1 Tax=Kribbella sp. NPDC048915 TaxID=3155148 RepID=UPI00340DDA26
MTTILVTGATGHVGRHVVEGLRAAGVSVRALVRTPAGAELPPDVELAPGDLFDPASVRRAAAGVDAAFLLWPAYDASGAAAVVDELPRRVVYLSSLNAPSGGVWGDVEQLLRNAGKAWTFVRPGGFATNTLTWADQIRTSDVVRIPSPEAGRSLIHERDIAAVAVLSLLDGHHIGRCYDLTGPEVRTQAEQIQIIAQAIGKDIRVEALSDAEARRQLLDQGADPAFVDSALAYWTSLIHNPEPVSTTVPHLTGRPALPFTTWAQHHAPAFRPGQRGS